MLNKKQQNIDNNTLNFSHNNNNNNNNKNKLRIHFHYLFAYNVCFAVPNPGKGRCRTNDGASQSFWKSCKEGWEAGKDQPKGWQEGPKSKCKESYVICI